MFSELQNGTLIYSKRFPKTLADDERASLDSALEDVHTGLPETFSEFMEAVDRKPANVPNPEKQKSAERLIEKAKAYADEYEAGIDITDYQYFDEIALYIDIAIFQRQEKTDLLFLMTLADEVSFDPAAREENCELQITLKAYTHDLYYDGKKHELY